VRGRIPSDLGVEEVLALRAHEPWYADAVSALYAEPASAQELARYRWLSAPLLYRQWSAAAQAQSAAEPAQFAEPATEGFYADFVSDLALPEWLAALTVPVLLIANEYDIWPTSVRALAALFGQGDLSLLPRIGHFPWVDDPALFAATVHEFLTRPPLPFRWSTSLHSTAGHAPTAAPIRPCPRPLATLAASLVAMPKPRSHRASTGTGVLRRAESSIAIELA
jgi:hypothetical protein